jgi:hypothetical protein
VDCLQCTSFSNHQAEKAGSGKSRETESCEPALDSCETAEELCEPAFKSWEPSLEYDGETLKSLDPELKALAGILNLLSQH